MILEHSMISSARQVRHALLVGLELLSMKIIDDFKRGELPLALGWGGDVEGAVSWDA